MVEIDFITGAIANEAMVADLMTRAQPDGVEGREESSKGSRHSKIIFVNRFFAPDETATSQILTDLALHLASSGFSVCVITSRQCLGLPDALPRRANLGGVHVRRVWSAPWGGRSVWGKLVQFVAFYVGAFAELLRTAKPRDIVIAKTDPPLISVLALIVTRLKGAKLVNWLQDLYPEVAAELDIPIVRGPLGRLLAMLRNWSLLGAHMNVAIGSTMARRLESFGVSPGRITSIPNWADEKAVRPLSSEASSLRRSWGLKSRDFVVGYSGNLGKAHEVETLVGAAKILRDQADIKFLFIGSGHQHERLRELVEEAELTNFVFKPHQPRELLAESLGAADIHWISLRPELEGLIVPSKLYGILAAGRPVLAICAAQGEISHIVREQDCGIVIEPGDCAALAGVITFLREDSGFREALGRRAREASERLYSKAKLLKHWTDLLSSLQSDYRLEDAKERQRGSFSSGESMAVVGEGSSV